MSGHLLGLCSEKPMTGFFRVGCCNTSDDDFGSHTVCVVVTAEFLEFSRARGNDLSTPRREFGFPGLQAGDRWCPCKPATAGAFVPRAGVKHCLPARRHGSSSTPPMKPRC